ncbi:MAG TPA: ABC transporter permease subunit [Symbiobacteriaceae bacterium]|nr:ABC transporter permease subunit [Symbiobacteriaceae bacterium]
MRRAVMIGLLLPLTPVVIWAFTPAWPWPDLWPRQMDLRAWAYLLSPGAGVTRAVLTSVGLALAVTLTCAVIGLPAGIGLGRCRFTGRGAVEVLVFLPLLVPPMAWSAGVHHIFGKLGLTGSLTAVWLGHLVPALPYMIRTIAAAATTASVRAEEVGRTLGATPWQVFRHLTLPRLGPALLAGSMLVFLVSLSQYLLTLLLGGGAVLTLPMVLLPFLAGTDRALAAALSLVFCGTGMLVLWLMESLIRRNANPRNGEVWPGL